MFVINDYNTVSMRRYCALIDSVFKLAYTHLLFAVYGNADMYPL